MGRYSKVPYYLYRFYFKHQDFIAQTKSGRKLVTDFVLREEDDSVQIWYPITAADSQGWIDGFLWRWGNWE